MEGGKRKRENTSKQWNWCRDWWWLGSIIRRLQEKEKVIRSQARQIKCKEKRKEEKGKETAIIILANNNGQRLARRKGFKSERMTSLPKGLITETGVNELFPRELARERVKLSIHVHCFEGIKEITSNYNRKMMKSHEEKDKTRECRDRRKWSVTKEKESMMA